MSWASPLIRCTSVGKAAASASTCLKRMPPQICGQILVRTSPEHSVWESCCVRSTAIQGACYHDGHRSRKCCSPGTQ
eukprot:1158399-Pelagomonas_calceolata.AAC.6